MHELRIGKVFSNGLGVGWQDVGGNCLDAVSLFLCQGLQNGFCCRSRAFFVDIKDLRTTKIGESRDEVLPPP